jgi:hypothetical protein
MFLKTEERPAGEVQQVGRLRLSEAIRIGAKLRPQCRETFFQHGRSCALGAAVEAITGKASADFQGSWEKFFNAPDEVFGPILIRNDSGEPRESIAAWLESQGL